MIFPPGLMPGFEPLANTPEKFAEFVKTETVRWGKVIRDAKLSLD